MNNQIKSSNKNKLIMITHVLSAHLDQVDVPSVFSSYQWPSDGLGPVVLLEESYFIMDVNVDGTIIVESH
jgi:hypothetical protein